MILAHDLGTTGDKASLVGADCRIVGSVTVSYGTDFGRGGKAEQLTSDWWDAVCEATRLLLGEDGDLASQIEAVSFSGQMMGAVLLDSAGEPIRPAIIWADTRSGAQANQLIDRVGMENAYRITGHRLNATYSLSKVMMVRDTEPDIFATARHLVLAKDYVAFRLTGVLATDPSDASSTNAYDQRDGRWSEELIDAARLDPSLFPDIIPSTAVVGRVTREAQDATGLRAGTPVVMGGGDGPMAALGAGIIGPESGAYCYLGSSSWISHASDAPLHDPLMRTMTFNHVVPGRFVPTATMQAGGASLEWIVDILEPGEPDRYERLLSVLPDTMASEDGLYFLPHLLGERSPYWNPHARAVFAGLARHHGPDNLVRAVVEGVGFNLLTGLQAFRENGSRIERVDAIGGVANSGPILEVLADMWGVPVGKRDLVDEATSVGAAVVGGVGVGFFGGFEIVATQSARVAEWTPRAGRTALYASAHETFLDAYRRLEPWFENL
jgi:xylulokinase